MTPDPYLVLVGNQWRCKHCGRWWVRRVGIQQATRLSTRMAPAVLWQPMTFLERVVLWLRYHFWSR